MPKRVLLLALFVVLQSTFAWASSMSESRTHSYTLDNGLDVIVREDHRAPVVTVMVWYRVGSIDEPAGMTGISHMLEHMLFKHTKHLTPGEYTELVARYGGRTNAFTSYEYTGYYQEYEASRLPLALELEAERMANLVIHEDEFYREAKVVHEERRQRTDDNPNALAWEKFAAILRPGTGYAHPVIGWQRDIEGYEPSQAMHWYEQWYAPNNAVVVVAGDVNAEETQQLVQKYFGALKTKNLPHRPAPQLAPPAGERRLNLQLAVQVPTLYMGWNVPSLATATDDEDFYALIMLAGVLDGGYSARIESNIVRGQRLAAGAGASYQGVAREDGVFTIRATANPDVSLTLLEKKLIEEIELIATTPPSTTELERVRAQVLASKVFGQDSVFGQAMELGYYAMANIHWQEADKFADKLAQITPDMVSKVAQRWLIPERMAVAHVQPQLKEEQ